jgi:uncharacterized protein YggU (UPF0235/DUF167 family)
MLAQPGLTRLKIRLTPQARARLKRQRTTVKVTVQTTFTPRTGKAAKQTLVLRLKR